MSTVIAGDTKQVIRSDNPTKIIAGTRGPPGPRGPEGPEGPPGDSVVEDPGDLTLIFENGLI